MSKFSVDHELIVFSLMKVRPVFVLLVFMAPLQQVMAVLIRTSAFSTLAGKEFVEMSPALIDVNVRSDLNQ